MMVYKCNVCHLYLGEKFEDANAVNRKRTDNTMVKRKRTKTTIYKTVHRISEEIEQHEPT